MTSNALTVDLYIKDLPEERKAVISSLRAHISKNLPKGFVEEMNYGMIGYVVPHSLYPAGYHCDAKSPLPFMNIASQKNFVAVYSMVIYSFPEIYDWFTKAYEDLNIGKLDMGKSCIRLKKMDKIPYELFGELASKISPQQWIEKYEATYIKK